MNCTRSRALIAITFKLQSAKPHKLCELGLWIADVAKKAPENASGAF